MTIRTTDPEQHRYLLGDDFEGVPSSTIATGAQLTPPRAHVIDLVDRLLPLTSDSFRPLESLAYGGLGNAWGAGCCVFSDSELAEAGLDPAAMRPAYQVVADRIGISGAADDATPYTSAGLVGVQPAPEMDETCDRLHRRYRSRRGDAQRRGRRPRTPGPRRCSPRTVAIGTRIAYRDMDFYDDRDRASTDRGSRSTRSRHDPRFHVRGRTAGPSVRGARRFRSRGLSGRPHGRAGRAIVRGGWCSRRERSGRRGSCCARKGVAGAALPILCNPYSYVPCLQPSLIGARQRPERMSLAQLSMFHDPDGTNSDVAMGSIYSYRSLMLFRILPQAPIAMVGRPDPDALPPAGDHDRRHPSSGTTRSGPSADAGGRHGSPTGDRLTPTTR